MGIRSNKSAVAVLFAMVFMLGLFAISLVYAKRVAIESENNAKRATAEAIEQNNQLMCDTLNQIHKGQLSNPPTTAAGKSFANSIEVLRTRYHCKD